MTRLLTTTCGVLLETAALETATSPGASVFAALGLLFGLAACRTELTRAVDCALGLTLPDVRELSSASETS